MIKLKNKCMNPFFKRAYNTAFTLLEILIVIALLALIITAFIVLINPKLQINKANDSNRKNDLAIFKKALEDYYNDHNCYPKPIEVCYSGTDNGDLLTKKTCFVCGKEKTSPSFSPYLNKLPCDPKHPTKKYFYQVDNTSCPTLFKIYSDFDNENDPVTNMLGCGNGGCGVAPDFGYDYGETSPNTELNKTAFFFCLTKTSTCDNCLYYENCLDNSNCLQIFATFDLCCKQKPKPVGCP